MKSKAKILRDGVVHFVCIYTGSKGRSVGVVCDPYIRHQYLVFDLETVNLLADDVDVNCMACLAAEGRGKMI